MRGALAPAAFSAPGRRCLSTYKLVGKPIWFCGLPSEAGLEARCGEAAKARAKSGKAVRYGSEADVCADLARVRLSAMCGRLQVGKSNLHAALLVGAAMCSAC
jgi:hypothetical protein